MQRKPSRNQYLCDKMKKKRFSPPLFSLKKKYCNMNTATRYIGRRVPGEFTGLITNAFNHNYSQIRY